MLYSTSGWLQTLPVQKIPIQKVCVQKHRWWRPVVWAALLALALLVVWQAATSGTLRAADAIALHDPWRFVDESKPGAPTAKGALATASTEAPTQVAARFNLSSTMQALALQLYDADLGGLPLAQVEELGYCTRVLDGAHPYAVTLQINLDADVTDGDDRWQGRLVYTPAYNGVVIQGEWQCWNTLAGKWWATGGPVAEHATADKPLPLATLLMHFPHLGINDTYSVLVLKAGDGWRNFEGEASPVVIGVEGERIDVAFGAAPQGNQPQDTPEGNEVLLPVLFNGSQAPEASSQDDDKPQDKPEDKPENNGEGKEPKDRWRTIDWADFDWESLDWEMVDWGAMGWDSGEGAEMVRGFVADVKKCKDKGWDEMGFRNPGDCVAYYVQEHSPADLKWSESAWGNNWNNRGERDEREERSRRGRRQDD